MHKANTEKIAVILFFFFLLWKNSSEYISFYEPKKIGLQKITSILGRCDTFAHISK